MTPIQPSRRVLLAAFALLLPACGALGPGNAGPLVVASDLENPPFAWVDEAGEPQGRDVEMMNQIAEMMGQTVEWRRMPFAELLPAAERGEVDVVCATMGATAERSKRVDFSKPYFRTRLAAVVRKDGPRTVSGLSGKRVSAGAGTTSEAAVKDRLWGAEGVFENKSGLPTAERLINGEVDAAVMDGPAAEALVAAHSSELRVLDSSLGDENYALAMPLGRDAFRRRVDMILTRLEKAGALDELNRRFDLRPDQ